MSRLNLQDSLFLGLESTTRPFHIAGLALCTLPPEAPDDFLRGLAQRLRKLPSLFPEFGKKLNHSRVPLNQRWVEAEDYDPDHHVFHYALPRPGQMSDLINMLSRVHERVLERDRPLWEVHLIEGLEERRFAFYCKFHHAMIDGVGALRLVGHLFSEAPDERFEDRGRLSATGGAGHKPAAAGGLPGQLELLTRELERQGRAVAELAGMLGKMSRRGLMQRADSPPLPFTAPHSVLNQNITAQRSIVIAELPLHGLKNIGAAVGGTVNDALIAICGGALRNYLINLDALPARSLFAGIPVSAERSGRHRGNQLSTMICPFGTDLADPMSRLHRIVHITRQAKEDLSKLSYTASQDYMNLLLLPALAFTLAGAATRVPPPFNAILSNVPGAATALYLDGATVDTMYPISLITDAMGLNITALSYQDHLCLGIIACPSFLPDITDLSDQLQQAFQAYRKLA